MEINTEALATAADDAAFRPKAKNETRALHSIRARLGTMITVALAAMTLLIGSAAPASAANGNVWINFSKTMCTGGGSVVGVYWAVDNVSSGPAGGDWGDNVIYPTVRIGAQSTISFTLMCKRWGWNTYRAGAGQRVLSPHRSGLSYTYYSYF